MMTQQNVFFFKKEYYRFQELDRRFASDRGGAVIEDGENRSSYITRRGAANVHYYNRNVKIDSHNFADVWGLAFGGEGL